MLLKVMFTINVTYTEYLIREGENDAADNEYGEFNDGEHVLGVLLLKEEQIERERKGYAKEFEVNASEINTYHLK